MGATTSHRRGYGSGYSGRSIQPQNVFWGWSHQNQQLEMMDLPAYLDSMRQTYDAALSDLSNRLQSMSTMFGQPPGGLMGIDMTADTDMGMGTETTTAAAAAATTAAAAAVATIELWLRAR